MPEPIVALFSSDARELYKADVYRAVALPAGYAIHFRYPRAIIHGSCLTKIDKLKNRKGVIFFVAGNDTNLPEDQRNITIHSVRYVTILDIDEDLEIAHYHFYLRLDEFADVTPHSGVDRDLLPIRTFVSEIPVKEGVNNKWIDRVKVLAPHFQGLAFLMVKGIWGSGKLLTPTYDRENRASRYNLSEESQYRCTLTWYNPGARDTGIHVENSKDSIVELSVPEDHRFGVHEDSDRFKLHTHSLVYKTAETSTYIYDRKGHYNGVEEPKAWRIQLNWTVTRRRKRAVTFGALSALAAVGLLLAKAASDQVTSRAAIFDWTFWALSLTALTCIWCSAGALYELFNKK